MPGVGSDAVVRWLPLLTELQALMAVWEVLWGRDSPRLAPPLPREYLTGGRETQKGRGMEESCQPSEEHTAVTLNHTPL